jgi:hypothetical protein
MSSRDASRGRLSRLLAHESASPSLRLFVVNRPEVAIDHSVDEERLP